jgi:hypothetical protein
MGQTARHELYHLDSAGGVLFPNAAFPNKNGNAARRNTQKLSLNFPQWID